MIHLPELQLENALAIITLIVGFITTMVSVIAILYSEETMSRARKIIAPFTMLIGILVIGYGMYLIAEEQDRRHEQREATVNTFTDHYDDVAFLRETHHDTADSTSYKELTNHELHGKFALRDGAVQQTHPVIIQVDDTIYHNARIMVEPVEDRDEHVAVTLEVNLENTAADQYIAFDDVEL